MKYILVMYLVAFVNEPPVVKEQKTFNLEYNSYFQCISDGYVKSYGYLMEIGEKQVDKQRLAIKFECKKIETT